MEIFKTIPSIGYQEQYQIRTYEIDSERRATIPALVKLMHEAAMQNVIQLKLSYWDLLPHQVSWVLLRKQLQVRRLPELGEEILVSTYPAGFDRFFTYRDYIIGTPKGEILSSSSSTWILMNTETRKMAPLLDFIKSFAPQMPPIENCLERPPGKLALIKKPERTMDFRVGWHDLDFNQHLNNTNYVQWMLETLPAHLLESGKLAQLDIHFRSECKYGDLVQSEVEENEPNIFLHQLKDQKEGKLLAYAQTKFRM